jgi:transposase
MGFKTGEGSASLERHGLSNEQWERVWAVLPGKVGDRGRSAADNRKFLDAVLWIAGTGAPWRDLPAHFGNWNSNFRRFRRWAVNGVFDMLFERLSGDRDFEYAMIDGTIVRVHQQGTGARGGLIVRRSDDRGAA